jgi:hypothetical protein
MLTIDDIRDDRRRSGFRGVTVDHGGHSRQAKPYRASKGVKGSGPNYDYWRGPRRETAEEAARDYCDYVNDDSTTPTTRLNSAGHSAPQRQRLPRDPEVEAALGVLRDARAQRQGKQGYVYCIGETQGVAWGVKVGYSVNPEKRVTELQTGNPRILSVIGKIKGTPDDEKRIHSKYMKYNLIGEWFVPTRELLSEFGLTSLGTVGHSRLEEAAA